MNDTANMIYNAECERAALAAIMSCDRRTAHILHDLTSDDFYLPVHQEVFRALQDIAARGDEPQLTTVDEELIKRGTLDAIGGSAGLVDLYSAFFLPSLVSQDVDKIHEHSARRRLKAISETLANKAFDRTEDVATTVLDIVGEISKIKLTESRWEDMSQVAMATYELIERVSKGLESYPKTGLWMRR